MKQIEETLTFGKISSLLTIGFGVGWLAGLSVSPIVSTLLSSIVGVTVMLVSIMSGVSWYSQQNQKEKLNNNPKIEEKSIIDRWKVHPAPIALLVLGIVIGSGVGIYVRTHNVLGVNSEEQFVEKWKALGKSSEKNPIITEEEIVQRLFDNNYPKDSNQTFPQKKSNEVNMPHTGSFLHATLNSSFCENLYASIRNKDKFKNLLMDSKLTEELKLKLIHTESIDKLEGMVTILCWEK